MRLTIPKLRMWHLLGIVATVAAYIATFQLRWTLDDPGYALIRQLRSSDARERTKAAGELAMLRPCERRAIAPLAEMLFDSDARARATAARTLQWVLDRKDEKDVGLVKAALASAIRDPDPAARLAIAGSLCGLNPEPGIVVPTLVELSTDRDVTTRARAASHLGTFARRSEPALAALLATLGDAEAEVRAWSAQAIGSCAEWPVVAPEPLLGRIKAALAESADDETPRVRSSAVRALGSLAARSRVEDPRIIEALRDPISEVRSAAARSLAWHHPGRRSAALVPALVLALADYDVDVRRMAARTLGTLGIEGEAALPALRASAGDPEETVREASTWAIEAIEKAARDLREVTLPQALAELGDADPAVRSLAATRLEDLGSRAGRAVPALVRCLADREAVVRKAAAEALGQLGASAAVAVPDLANLAESDPDERVRNAARSSRSILLRNGTNANPSP